MRRALPTVVIALLLLLPGVAAGADRNFSLRYTTNTNGQITIAANTIVQCPLDTPDPLMNSGCQGTRDGTSSRNNNSFDMRWLDVDGDTSTFTSSSADLALPAGARVLFAGLYWTGIQKRGDVIRGANGFVGTPQNPPDVNAIGTVRLDPPGPSGYATVTASQVDTGPIAVGSGYTAFADVTARVASAGPGTYTVADVQTGTGGNIAAGWSLVVAYSSQSEPLRNLSVFDGLRVVSGSSTVSIPLSGFKTPTSGPVRTTIGVVAAEGDAGATGDYLTLNDQRLTDAVHPPNNTENSSIAHYGQQVTTKNPDWRNQLGYDSSLFDADGFLANGTTTAMFRAKTSGDVYAPQAITFATELFSPNVTLTKTVTEVDGSTQPGATLRYTITATNNGAADAIDVQLVDPIPSGTAYNNTVPVSATNGSAEYVSANGGSIVARLGTGATSSAGGRLAPNATATVTFDVDIDGDRPLGEVIDNEATLSFTSPDLGLPISTVASADVTVEYPDPGIVKRFVSSSGNQYTFALDVTNQGTLATDASDAVIVIDPEPAGATSVVASGTDWSCSRNTGTTPAQWECLWNPANPANDSVAAGAAYPPINVTVTYSPGALVENDASVSGGGQPTATGSPALLNDDTFIGVGTSPLSLLVIDKSALTGTVNVGSLAGYRIQIRNLGPSPSPNTILTDELPAGLTYSSATTSRGSCSTTDANGRTTVRCDLGEMAVGADATVTIRATVGTSLAGTTVNNEAVVQSDTSSGTADDDVNLVVRPATDLAVTKTASAATIDEGDPVTYTITATNQGPESAVRMQVVDRLPAAIDTAGTITITPSDSGTCTRTDDVVQCLWTADVPANATRTVTIAASAKATVPADERQALNRVNVFSKTTELDPKDNYTENVVTVIPAADLQVVAGGPSTIAAGGEGTVSFTVTNNGPSSSSSTSLAIVIPNDLTPVAAPAGCTISGQNVTCDTGTIANGASLVRDITVRANADLTEATREATARVSSSVTDDPVPENDTDVAPFIAGPVADLTITKAADVAEVAPGGVVNYTLTIANAGGSSSTGAVVVDDLPYGMVVESATSSIPEGCAVNGREVRCDAGEIVPNASFQVLIVARVDEDRAGATLINTATLTPGAERDPNADNNTASATVQVTTPAGTTARLSVRVLSPTRVKQGRLVKVRVRVKNISDNAANDVRICVTVPTRFRYLRSNGDVVRTRTTRIVRSRVTGKRVRVRRVHTQICWDRTIMTPDRQLTFTYRARARRVGFATPHAYAEAGNADRVRGKDRTRIIPRGTPPKPTG